MKRILQKSVLLLCALTAGVLSTWADDSKVKWVKTVPADLVDGDVVAIVDTTTCVAMANDPKEGKAPSAKSVTLNANKDQLDTSDGDLAANLQWTVAISADGQFQFKKDDTNFLFAKPNNADTDSLLVGAATGEGEVSVFSLVKDEANNQADFLFARMSEESGYYVGVFSYYGIFNTWTVRPAINEDISATVLTFFKKVNSDKKDLKISFEKDNYEFDLDGGETFTSPVATTDPEGKTLSYTSSNEYVAKVDASTGEVTVRHRGIATITASFAEDEEYDATSASYTLRVDESNGEGGMNNPLSASDAYDAITNNNVATGVVYFIKGVVSKIGGDDLGSILSMLNIPGLENSDGGVTYYISDDGSSADGVKQIEVTAGHGLENANLEANRSICVGDEVIVVGQVSNSSSTPGITGTETEKKPKIDKGNYLNKHTPRIIAPDAEVYLGTSHKVSEMSTVNNECETAMIPGEPTVELSNDALALASDKLNANKEGTDTITISCPFKANESDADAVFTTVKKFYVTVKPTSVEAAGKMPGFFSLVTDASTLQENDSILIVATTGEKSYALSSTAALMGGMSGKEVKFEDDGSISSVPDGATPVKLKAVSGKWAMNTTDNNYLYTSVNSGGGFDLSSLFGEPTNKLRHGEIAGEIGDSAQVTIAIDAEGLATIKFRSTEAEKDSLLCYNETSIGSSTGSTGSTTSSDSYKMGGFDCLASDNTSAVLVKLYRFQETPHFDITVAASGWRTLVSSKDVSLPEGLKAYIVSEVADGKATLQEVTTLKADNPYILKGAEGATYTLSIALGVPAPEGNLLRISTKSTGDGVYVLATKAGVTGFYKWDGGLLGTGRVYLPAPSAARGFLSISFDDATAIDGIMDKKGEAKAEVIDLSGRRVVKPTKGVYILGGKKTVVK